MENKLFTVAIIGAGSRGADAYGTLINKDREKFKIVSICDVRQERLDRFGELFEVEKSELFTDEDAFFTKKRADLLIIATQDADHFRHALKAFELGYDVLLEKPLTDKIEECEALLAAQKKYAVKAMVCHVLRYAPAYIKLAELLKSGIIGRLIGMNVIEGVTYWHQAHSYVRGNWRSSKTSTPMILAKCCHDLDLIQYYAGSPCKSVSSIGSLSFFKKECAPENSTERCVDCPHINDCPYSAKAVYVDRWEIARHVDMWPYNVVTTAPITKEKLEEAIKTGPYGKCVFRCDNDVVDNQIVMMDFENGVKAELTMTGFSAGRRYHLYGTHGQLILDSKELKVDVFGKPDKSYVLPLAEINEKGHAHGGGDAKLINALYGILCGDTPADTSLTASIESHLIGILAEKSRLENGKPYKVH